MCFLQFFRPRPLNAALGHMYRLLRLRPLLCLAVILAAAILISMTWEKQTSYDDGGLGTFAFVVIGVFGTPWTLVGLNYALGSMLSLLALVVGDIALARRLRRASYDKTQGVD